MTFSKQQSGKSTQGFKIQNHKKFVKSNKEYKIILIEPYEALGERVDVLGSVTKQGRVDCENLVVVVHPLDVHLQVKSHILDDFNSISGLVSKLLI